MIHAEHKAMPIVSIAITELTAAWTEYVRWRTTYRLAYWTWKHPRNLNALDDLRQQVETAREKFMVAEVRSKKAHVSYAAAMRYAHQSKLFVGGVV